MGNTALHAAVEFGDVAKLEALLRSETGKVADIDATNHVSHLPDNSPTSHCSGC